MKKLLIGLGIQFGLLCGVQAQTPNIIKAHSASRTDTIALGLVDSIVHTTDSMQLYLGNIRTNYALNSVDSFSYAYVAANTIPCNLGGYTGTYGTIVDSRDGNEYKTVTIGTQTWMAENLRYDVPNVYTVSGNSVDTISQNNLCRSYGRLYDWMTVMNGDTSSNTSPSGVQGICPSGWHVPSDAEWKTLEKTVGMSQTDADNRGWRGTNEAFQLKSTSGWSNNGNGNNASGFNLFPAGRYYSGTFTYIGDRTNFWFSTEDSLTSAWYRTFRNLDDKVYRGSFSKMDGYACRCVKN